MNNRKRVTSTETFGLSVSVNNEQLQRRIDDAVAVDPVLKKLQGELAWEEQQRVRDVNRMKQNREAWDGKRKAALSAIAEQRAELQKAQRRMSTLAMEMVLIPKGVRVARIRVTRRIKTIGRLERARLQAENKRLVLDQFETIKVRKGRVTPAEEIKTNESSIDPSVPSPLPVPAPQPPPEAPGHIEPA